MQTWKRISARSFQTLCVLLAGMPSAEAIRLAGIEHRHRLAYRSINTALCAPLALVGRGRREGFRRLRARMSSDRHRPLTQHPFLAARQPHAPRYGVGCIASRQGRAASTRIQLSGLRCCKAAGLANPPQRSKRAAIPKTLLDSCAIVAMHIESAQVAFSKVGIRTGPVLQRK